MSDTQSTKKKTKTSDLLKQAVEAQGEAERATAALRARLRPSAAIIRSICRKWQINVRYVQPLAWTNHIDGYYQGQIKALGSRRIEVRCGKESWDIDSRLIFGSDRDIAKATRAILRDWIARKARETSVSNSKTVREMQQRLATLQRELETAQSSKNEWKGRQASIERRRAQAQRTNLKSD